MYCRNITNIVLHIYLTIDSGLWNLASFVLLVNAVSSQCRRSWLHRQQGSSRQSVTCRSRLAACRTRWRGLKMPPALHRYTLGCIHIYTMLSLAAESVCFRCAHTSLGWSCTLHSAQGVSSGCRLGLPLNLYAQKSHGRHVLCCVRVTDVNAGGGCSKTADGDG